MFKTKFVRHGAAFLIIFLASILIYPIAENGMDDFIWPMLSLIIGANIFTVFTK